LIRLKGDDTLSELALTIYPCLKAESEEQFVAFAHALAWFRQYQPLLLVRLQSPDEKEFYLSSRRGVTAAAQSGGKNAGIVQNEAVTGPQILRKVREHIVVERMLLS
jgi:hypothetical protein